MDLRSNSYDVPTERDWDTFREKFGTAFGPTFRSFIELMSKYEFPGEIFNVASGNVSLSSSIYKVYDYEITQEFWNNDMVPFYSLGTGDYFCLSMNQGCNSKVYFFRHSDNTFEVKHESFSEWVDELGTWFS